MKGAPRSIRRLRGGRISMVLTVLLMLFAVAPAAQADHAGDPNAVATTPNPPFPTVCGLDVGIVLDTSNSIFNDSPNNPGIMRDAAKAFVDALTGTPSSVGVYSFQTTATLELAATDVRTAAGANTVKAAIDGVTFGQSSPTGGTNWQDGFEVATGQGLDVIVYATDGNPTTHNGDGDAGIPPGEPEDLHSGIVASNAAKAEGTRVIGIGIGGSLDEAKLQRITGPTVDDDYYLPASFAAFRATLEAIARRLCAPSVSAVKLVGDGAGNFTPATGWQFAVTLDPATPVTANPANGATDAGGSVNFKWNSVNPTDVQLVETPQAGLTLDSVTCSLQDGTLVTTAPITNGVALTVGFEDIVRCEFRNTPIPPGLDLVKTPDVQTAKVGDTITYTFTVTNTGPVELTDITVVDDKLGAVTLAATTLAASASTTGTATATVTAADLAGPLVNVAVATGTDPTGAQVTDQDDASVALAALGVVKAPSQGIAMVGDTVTYTYTVTNTGSAPLDAVTVVDDKLGPITLDKTSLAPGESATGTATTTAATGDLPGPIVNVATAGGTTPDGVKVEASDDATVQLAALGIAKVVNVTDASAGDTVTYTYTVTNTGSVGLTGIVVNDDVVGAITLAATTLAPGESTTGTATYTVTAANEPGPLVNIATASGQTPPDPITGEQRRPTDEDTVSLPIIVVLPQVATTTTTTTTTTTPTTTTTVPTTLPATGLDNDETAGLGTALVLMGALLLIAAAGPLGRVLRRSWRRY